MAGCSMVGGCADSALFVGTANSAGAVVSASGSFSAGGGTGAATGFGFGAGFGAVGLLVAVGVTGCGGFATVGVTAAAATIVRVSKRAATGDGPGPSVIGTAPKSNPCTSTTIAVSTAIGTHDLCRSAGSAGAAVWSSVGGEGVMRDGFGAVAEVRLATLPPVQSV